MDMDVKITKDEMVNNTRFIDEFSEEIYNQTYRYGEEDINDTHLRVAKNLASIENDKEYWTKEFLYALEDFKFVPGGRITSNAGTGLKGTTYVNCFVDGLNGEDQDSMEGIMGALKRQALILKSEGGYGFCADVMRPRGAFINGIGSDSPGAVKMLDMWDTQSAVITSGSGKKSTNKKAKQKIRKGAQMVTMSVWNSDIEEFITAKQTPGRLTKFNMSILVTDDFMEAVDKKLPWNLKFPDYEKEPEAYKKEWDGNIQKWEDNGYPVKVYKTFEDANELYDLIMESTYNRNEPGILFHDTINRMNNLHYNEFISATNPCVVGDTKVAVADGSINRTIKELSDLGDDVPVYCLNDNGKLVIRMMRSPRITGYNEPIYKVKIENGHEIRVTGNHKFRLKNGEYKEAKYLTNGDSLYMLSKFNASFKDIFSNSNSNSQDYIWLKEGGKKTQKSEHRLIAEFHNNSGIPNGYVVHHIDYNAQNNSPDNLRVMTTEDHNKLHTENMFGDKNPMRRAATEWSAEKWEDYRTKMSASTSGELNGRFSGITEQDFRDLALELTAKLERRFSTKEWYEFCEENDKKYSHTNWRVKKLGTVKALGKWAALELGFDKYLDDDPRMVKNLKKWTEQGYNCKIEKGGLIYIKECEICGNEFDTLLREHSSCSTECNNKRNSIRNKDPEFIKKCTEGQRKRRAIYKEKMRESQMKIYSDLKFELKREPFRKEWEDSCKDNEIPFRVGKSSPFKNFTELREVAVDYNHKVISVESDGYENVYNGTVDDFHNFFVGEFNEKTKNDKRNLLYINNLQCGEQLLPIGGVCLLGSLNLTQFVDFGNKDWDYTKLKKVIPIAVRFMDNVNDVTNVPLPSQKQNLKDKRRIGLGIMGYGSALMMLKLRYGSKKSLEITEKLMGFIMNEAYKASSLISKEKGSFLLYDEKEYLSGNFIKGIDKSVISSIKKNGIRNSHLLSIQPTGNCLSSKTKIKTNDGVKSLKRIFDDNLIDLKNCEDKKWFTPIKNIEVDTIYGNKKITGLYVNGYVDTLEITIDSNNKIIGTPEHKVLVKLNDSEAIWKKIGDLNIDDIILSKT